MKRFFRVVAASLLVISLIGTAAALSLRQVAGSSDQLKQSLDESGLYESLSDNLAGSAVAIIRDKGITIPEAEVHAAAKNSFTPQLLKDSTENLADGVYNWLQGKVEQPDFRIDLTQAKDSFANELGRLAAERINGLPGCTLADLQRLRETSQDEALLQLQCKPPGYDPAAAAAAISQFIKGSDEFLPDTVITAGDFPKDEQGRTVFEQFADAPVQFQQVINMAWVPGLISLLLIGILLLLTTPKLLALKIIGWSLIVAGLLAGIAQVFVRFLAKTTVANLSISPNISNYQPVITGVTESFSGAFGNQMLRYGLLFVFIGLVLLATYFAVRKRRMPKE